jgi:WD40 repeat protein
MSESAEPEYKYWAFISYSHKDVQWGRWFFAKLKRYRIPRELAGQPAPYGPTTPTKLKRIFRDKAEMPASPDLWGQIRTALEKSRYLIVLCSPHSRASDYVDKEIRVFKQLGREDRILPVIVGGKPNASEVEKEEECFPLALLRRIGPDGELSDEECGDPHALNVSACGRLHRLLYWFIDREDTPKDALQKLVASILRCDLAELKQEDRKRRRRSIGALASSSLLLLAVFALLGVTALVQRERAVEAEVAATAISLAEQAASLEERGPQNIERSVLLAVESMRLQPSVLASQVLRSTLSNLRPRLKAFEGTPYVDGDPVSRSGRFLVTMTGGVGARPRIWHVYDLVSLERVGSGEAGGSQTAVAITDDDEHIVEVDPGDPGAIVSASHGLAIRTREIKSGTIVKNIEHNSGSQLFWLSRGGRFVGVILGGALAVYDVDNGQAILATNLGLSIRDLSFSSDERRVAVVGGGHAGPPSFQVPRWRPKNEAERERFNAELEEFKKVAQAYEEDQERHEIVVFELPSGRDIWRQRLSGEASSVWLGPQGRYVAVNSKPPEIWDVVNDRRVETSSRREDVCRVVFSPDARFLATASLLESRVMLFDLPDGDLVSRLPHCGGDVRLAFSPDGSQIAIAGDWVGGMSGFDTEGCLGTAVLVYDGRTGRRIAAMSHQEQKNMVAPAADGELWITSGGPSDLTYVWDNVPETRQVTMEFPARIADVAFSPDGSRIGIGGDESLSAYGLPAGLLSAKSSLIQVLDASDGQVLASAREVGGYLSFSDDAEFIKAGASPGRYECFLRLPAANETELIIDSIQDKYGLGDYQEWRAREKQDFLSWREVSFSADGDSLLLSRHDSGIRILHRDTGELKRALKTTMGAPKHVVVNPEFTCAASVADGGVDFWRRPLESRPGDGESEQRAPDSSMEFPVKTELNKIAHSQNGSVLAVFGGGDFSAAMQRGWGGGGRVSSALGSGDVEELANSQKQAMEGLQRELRERETPVFLYSVCDGSLRGRTTINGFVVRSALSPSGEVLAAVTYDGDLHLIDPATGTAIGQVGHDARLVSVALSSNGEYVATGTTSGLVQVYEVATRIEVARLQHDDAVSAVAFSPDGKLLLAGSLDGTARLWEWSPGDLLEMARTRVFRNLTEQEWAQYLPDTEYQPTFPDR